MADVNDQLIRSGRHAVVTIRHEALIADPQRELARLCELLAVEPEPAYLDACAAIVYDSPHRTRDDVSWSAGDRGAVDAVLARHEFLRDYSFDGV
jgi:hypothetical protein